MDANARDGRRRPAIKGWVIRTMEQSLHPPDMQHRINRIVPGWSPTSNVSSGWYSLLARLGAHLSAIAPGYVLQQCKSKLGSSSFYAAPTDDVSEYNEEFDEAIHAAESEHRDLRGVQGYRNSVRDPPLGVDAAPQTSRAADCRRRPLRIVRQVVLTPHGVDPLVSVISGKIRFNFLEESACPNHGSLPTTSRTTSG